MWPDGHWPGESSGSGTVTPGGLTDSPGVDYQSTLELFSGDTYLRTETGRIGAKKYDVEVWPDLTGAAITLVLSPDGGEPVEIDGAVVTATGDDAEVDANVLAADIPAPCTGEFWWYATLPSGSIRTLRGGRLILR